MVGFAGGDNRQAELETLRRENANLQGSARALRDELDGMRRSTSWRLTAPLCIAVRFTRAILRPCRGHAIRLPMDETGYQIWRARDDADRRRRLPSLRQQLATTKLPSISLLMVVRDAPAYAIDASLASLNAQIFQDWQLCIVDAASVAPHVPGMLAHLADDPRVRTRRQDTSDTAPALRIALSMADNDTLGLLHPGEQLPPDALATFALLFRDIPEIALAYADEDRINASGHRSSPRFKSGWSADLLLTDPEAIGRPWLIRLATLEAAGGFAGRFPGAEAYDLQLRTAQLLSSEQVAHVPRILAHVPVAEPFPSPDAAQAALAAAQAEDPGVRLLRTKAGHWFAWSHRATLVSVIIPTRDRADLLAGAAAAVLAEEGVDLELLIADNDSHEAETEHLFAKLRQDRRVRILPMPGPFNWSVLNTAAIAESRGDVLLLLNNDIAAIRKNWLAPLAAEAMRPAIGIVGAKLLYPDDTVKHGGIWLGSNGAPFHLLRFVDKDNDGYLGQLAKPRNLLAVTGACLAIRRGVFDEIGGLDPRFPVAFNDVDLCLRAVRAGYRVLWTPQVVLRHLEAASRGDPASNARGIEEQQAFAQFRAIWATHLGRDPYFNPNLDIGDRTGSVLVHPWRSA